MERLESSNLKLIWLLMPSSQEKSGSNCLGQSSYVIDKQFAQGWKLSHPVLRTKSDIHYM
jgi:hypothetical protein